jgi:hypothetical protein
MVQKPLKQKLADYEFLHAFRKIPFDAARNDFQTGKLAIILERANASV